MASSLVAKISSMCILGGVSLFLGLLPIKLSAVFNLQKSASDFSNKPNKSSLLLSALSCFGAGVILTTCLTHMLPEVNYFLNHNIKHGAIRNVGLPLAEIFVMCGFLMIYITEELAHTFIEHMRNGKRHNRDGGSINEEMDSATANNIVTVTNASHGSELHMITSQEETFQATLRGFLVILALSLHAVFEGIAIGLVGDASFVWYLCFAVAAHKFVISFCLGVQFVATTRLSTLLIVAYQSVFSLISPLGIGIGIALTETGQGEGTDEKALQTPLITVLQGLAAGTLVYVVFFEVLEKERKKKINGLLQVTSFILGFAVMIAVQLAEGEDHHGNSGSGPFCTIMPEDVSSFPANITCIQGQLKFVNMSGR